MARLEDLQPDAAVRGILPDALVTVVSVQWFGSEALGLTYKSPAGKLARNADVQAKLQAPGCRWDLVVCDEAHKLSATFFGGEIKYTRRYKLGQLLSTLTRHFLLMTATPHNGKEEDLQLFMALLDGDRFEGRFRDGVHQADVSDLMRRMVKESLRKFDGTPLFPERIAYTVPYRLSDAEARRLQPHHIESFFLEAFPRLGGTAREREPGRYEVTHVPAPVRNRDRLIGMGEPVLARHERIAFEKDRVAPRGEPLAAFVCPGHPLLDAVIDLTLERQRDLLRRGTVLVDERDPGTEPRVLFYLEHALQDASLTRAGERRVISKRLLYVGLDAAGHARHLHYAPDLDYRPLRPEEPAVDALLALPECAWISRDLERKALGHAVARVVPEHLAEVGGPRLELIGKTEVAVKDRLTKEIVYWDHRAQELKLQEQAGRPNARLNSAEATRHADTLQGRLEKRLEDLKRERQIAPLRPVVLGGLLEVPAGLLAKLAGRAPSAPRAALDTRAAAARARAIVMATERELGFEPVERETEKLGYDIESRIRDTGRLRFIGVKGRVVGAETITVTRSEILYSLNKLEDFILALVEPEEGVSHPVHYLRQPFQRKPDFGVTSVNYDFAELLARARLPG